MRGVPRPARGIEFELLAELVEFDRRLRDGDPLSEPELARRAEVGRLLSEWALARQAQRPNNQRQQPRAALRLRVVLDEHPDLELFSDDVGLGGISLSLQFRPLRYQLLTLRLVPAPPEEPLLVSAEVMWVDAIRNRAGLRFRDLNDRQRALLERIVFSRLVGQ